MKKYSIQLITLFLILISTCIVGAQTGISLNTPDATDSYTLFEKGARTYLVDNCGGLVNEWNNGFSAYLPKLQANGNLVYLEFWGVVERDWDNNVVNQIEHEDFSLDLKYEVIVLPNGNYLCVGRRNFSRAQFLDMGYNLAGVSPTEVDVVVELDKDTGEIVWEWNISDHAIQQRDPELANYGILSENPQLLNMDAIARYDWNDRESFMINGMDYNPELDQIILSVRKMSEIVIIDHSTTTEEAEGSTGGQYGKGGDILYRWGNPQNYNRGTEEDRILFFQHNPNWITEGELTGHIICYNNGLNRPGYSSWDGYSTVPIIKPIVDQNGNYALQQDQAYEPMEAPLEFSRVHTNTEFYSSYTSGAQYMPNGNIYITEGVNGRLLEVNPSGELVWQYVVPNANYLFRSVKHPANYPAFEGRDMTADGLVTFDNSTYECELDGLNSTSTNDKISTAFEVSYDWSDKQLQVRNTLGQEFTLAIYNVQGQSMLEQKQAEQARINLSSFPKGMYFLRLVDDKSQKALTQKILVP